MTLRRTGAYAGLSAPGACACHVAPDGRIVYCPVHAQAPALLALLQRSYTDHAEIHVPLVEARPVLEAVEG